MATPIESYRYKLRAANAQEDQNANFILQSFMAERSLLQIFEAKPADELLVTDDFRGQGGEYQQANYSRLPYKTQDGDQVFSATEEFPPIYIDEDDIPGTAIVS